MTTIVSAPGKVLLTGGYLVLDPAYQGLVISTDARFYTVVNKSANLGKSVVVKSPQFEGGRWDYDLSVEEDKVTVTQSSLGGSNKFVESALKYCFVIIYQIIGLGPFVTATATGLEISIVGNNDFYSQRKQLLSRSLPLTIASLRALAPFCPTRTTLNDVHKTGLGSSAALITSLVAALFVHFKAVTLEDPAGKKLVHNVAQFVHCFAQGKVGSGFDVSSGVWGSHRYRRFDPKVLGGIMDGEAGGEVILKTLDASNSAWDNIVTPFKLPPHLTLVLADIDAGSHTPTLVSKVLAWRKAKPDEADALWKNLHALNITIEDNLRELSRQSTADPVAYNSAISECAKIEASRWAKLPSYSTDSTIATLADTADTFQRIRTLIRKMSELSDVPIEPAEQTRLLDRCMTVPGCVMAGVPGAGGFDAIFCIVISEEAIRGIEGVWQGWEEMSVGPLLAQEDFVGVRVETLESVVGLKEVL